MAACLQVPGLAEAERLYGRPLVRTYDLDDWGDQESFWQMWSHRLGEVALVLRRPDGRVILQTKSFYPPGAYRLLTGSIQLGENLLAAVRRETWEETGLVAQVIRFLGVLCYHFRRFGEPQERASYVFLLEAGLEALQPQDETEHISASREVPLGELGAVADQLEHLPEDWAAWGRFRALLHRFVDEAMDGRDGE